MARPFAPLALLLLMGLSALAAAVLLKPGDWAALVQPLRNYFAGQQSADPKALEYVKSGNELLDQGEYDQAIAEFSAALAIDPNYAAAYEGRGNVYFVQGYYSTAIADYDHIILLYPKYAYAYFRRAVAYYNKGDYERAIAGYNEAIKLSPGFVLAYTNRRLALLNRNDSALPSPITFSRSDSVGVMHMPAATVSLRNTAIPSHNISGAAGIGPRNVSWPTMRQSGWVRNSPWSGSSAASPPRARAAATMAAPSRATVSHSGWVRR
ncbi:MAG TPA: tetratricopeptide repeat protein [Xanthobacteraceae bacterium]|nr:tetratricopeptide repeat protein [Xanthobacteraceae bacterium]